MSKKRIVLVAACVVTVIVVVALVASELGRQQPVQMKTRAESIPPGAVKVTPETDLFKPVLHSSEWFDPVPAESPVNTAGAEDSAFVLPDGETLYLFFTPNSSVPANEQLFDGVTGIWVSHRVNGMWSEPERVVLQDAGKLSLDGAEFVMGNSMWFASAREGNYRDVDLWTAEYVNGIWTHWQNAGHKLNVDYWVGEMHITADGSEMYFHSNRSGGKGGVDVWLTRKANGEWQTPANIEIVNSAETDGWPFITQDGDELWFTRWYLGSPAVYRSKKFDGVWSEPELIISQFAAEPSLDDEGNIYFTHHFFKDGKMIEADIYVARHR